MWWPGVHSVAAETGTVMEKPDVVAWLAQCNSGKERTCRKKAGNKNTAPEVVSDVTDAPWHNSHGAYEKNWQQSEISK